MSRLLHFVKNISNTTGELRLKCGYKGGLKTEIVITFHVCQIGYINNVIMQTFHPPLGVILKENSIVTCIEYSQISTLTLQIIHF